MASITDTLLTDSQGRVFDLSIVYVRTDGSFVVVLQHPSWGELPYHVTSTDDAEVWTAISEWKTDNADHFESDSDEEETETDSTDTSSTEDDEETLLSEARTAKLEKLAKKFATASEEAYVNSSLGFRADADSDANRNVSGLITLMSDDEETTVQFCDYDNNMQELKLADLKVLQLEIIQNACSLYQQKWAYRDAIEDAETREALKEIKINFTYMSFSSDDA